MTGRLGWSIPLFCSGQFILCEIYCYLFVVYNISILAIMKKQAKFSVSHHSIRTELNFEMFCWKSVCSSLLYRLLKVDSVDNKEKQGFSTMGSKYFGNRIYWYHLTSVTPLQRGALCQFPFRWIYYYGSNKSTGKETAKTHICALHSVTE